MTDEHQRIAPGGCGCRVTRSRVGLLAHGISAGLLLTSTAWSAAADQMPPVLPSPLVVHPQLPAPPGTVALALDPERVAAIERSLGPGAITIEDFPVAPDTQRRLHLRRAVRMPELAVEVVHGSSTLGFTVAKLAADELAQAEGLILVGAVAGVPASRAVVSIGPAGVFAMIDEEGHRFVVSSGPAGLDRTPLAFDIVATPSLIDVVPWSCASGEDILERPDASSPPSETQKEREEGGLASGAPCTQVRVAFESDHAYFNLMNGDPIAAANYALLLSAAAGEIAAGGPHVRIGLVYLRLWATAEEPWNKPSAPTQLDQLRSVWNATMDGIPREIAHFLSGRVLGGGAAWTKSLCSNKAYSLSSNMNGFFPYPLLDNHPQNWDVIVVAHELGHNLGGKHTHEYGMESPDLCGFGECLVGPQGTILSYCFICPGGMANIKLLFAPISNASINSHMAAVACLPPVDDPTPIAVEDFAFTVNGATVELDLLANDLPANCLPVVMTSAESVSVAGGVVKAPGGLAPVLYTAPIGFIGLDSFAYAIVAPGSSGGQTAIGQAFIWVKPRASDLNADGRVDGADLAMLLGVWGGGGPTGDLDGNGTVDGADVAVLLGEWTG